MIEVLPKLYGSVVVPLSVSNEALHHGAPVPLREWMASPPAWLQVLPDPAIIPEVLHLGPGEAAAISLAWHSRPNALVILDDRAARGLCSALGLPCTGAAGVLLAAARAGLVDFESAVQQMQRTSFRLSASVIQELRRRL